MAPKGFTGYTSNQTFGFTSKDAANHCSHSMGAQFSNSNASGFNNNDNSRTSSGHSGGGTDSSNSGFDNFSSFQSCLQSSGGGGGVASQQRQMGGANRGTVNWDVIVDNVFKEEISKAASSGWANSF